MKKKRTGHLLFLCLLLLSCICFSASAETPDLGVYTLDPVPLPGVEGAPCVPLRCGPTAQFPGCGDEIDLSSPFLFFGQADCWAMVAAGSAEEPGPVGWIESAACDLPAGPELLFEDAVPVTVMEDTFLTLQPLAVDPPRFAEITEGTQPVVLAVFGGWAYVQLETGDAPVRAFLPLSSFL